MATNTPNYNLVKPDGNDVPDIAVMNGNMDRIDTQIKLINDALIRLSTRINTLEAVTNIDWRSDNRTWHDKPNGYYQVLANGVSLGYPENFLGILNFSQSPGSNVFQVGWSNTNVYFRRYTSTQPTTWTTLN